MRQAKPPVRDHDGGADNGKHPLSGITVGTDAKIRSIEWLPIELPPRQAGFFRRFVPDFRRMRALFGATERQADTDVFLVTFGNASIMWSLKLLTATAFRQRSVQVVLHGDFTTLRYRTSMRLVTGRGRRISAI